MVFDNFIPILESGFISSIQGTLEKIKYFEIGIKIIEIIEEYFPDSNDSSNFCIAFHVLPFLLNNDFTPTSYYIVITQYEGINLEKIRDLPYLDGPIFKKWHKNWYLYSYYMKYLEQVKTYLLIRKVFENKNKKLFIIKKE